MAKGDRVWGHCVNTPTKITRGLKDPSELLMNGGDVVWINLIEVSPPSEKLLRNTSIPLAYRRLVKCTCRGLASYYVKIESINTRELLAQFVRLRAGFGRFVIEMRDRRLVSTYQEKFYCKAPHCALFQDGSCSKYKRAYVGMSCRMNHRTMWSSFGMAVVTIRSVGDFFGEKDEFGNDYHYEFDYRYDRIGRKVWFRGGNLRTQKKKRVARRDDFA